MGDSRNYFVNTHAHTYTHFFFTSSHTQKNTPDEDPNLKNKTLKLFRGKIYRKISLWESGEEIFQHDLESTLHKK